MCSSYTSQRDKVMKKQNFFKRIFLDAKKIR